MKHPALTDEDLTWFEQNKYSPPKLSCLSLEQWAVIINDRMVLRSMLERGAFRDVLQDFEDRLRDDPLCLDVAHRPRRVGHKTDMPSITLLNYSQLSELHSSNIGAVPADPIEPVALRGDKYQLYGAPFEMAVPVLVDFSATRAQLVDDFGRWLDKMCEFIPPAKNRDYRTTTGEWAEYLYLPYFDLQLFAWAAQKELPQAKMVEMLGLTHPTKSPNDQLKAPRKSLDLFTPKTLAAIELQIASGR